MLGHWNDVGGPFADGLNAATKYVVSSKGDSELPWPNSVLVSGDVPARIGALRAEAGGNLVIMGSSQLIQSLMSHDLVDELFLMIHPLVLGSGLRLFGPEPFRPHVRAGAEPRVGERGSHGLLPALRSLTAG